MSWEYSGEIFYLDLFFLGTNGYVFDDIYYKIAWNNDLLPKLKPLFLNSKKIPLMIKDFNVPVIHERSDNPFYESSLKLSNKLANEVLKQLSLSNLTGKYGLINKEQALIIVYHELMWDILEAVEKLGLFTKPAIIAKPDQGSDSNITDLVFIVDA